MTADQIVGLGLVALAALVYLRATWRRYRQDYAPYGVCRRCGRAGPSPHDHEPWCRLWRLPKG